MDNTTKRMYRVDPIYLSTFQFYAPRELVNRKDIVVCVEYKLRKDNGDNGMLVEYWTWCHSKDDTKATMVYHEVFPFVKLCGVSTAIEAALLNKVLQSNEAVREIQKIAGAWPESEV